MLGVIVMMANIVFPDWGAFTPETADATLERELRNAEAAVTEFEKKETATYEELEWQLGDAMRPLWDCWGMASHMLSVMNDEKWRELEEKWQPRLVQFSLRVGQSKPLYRMNKALAGGEKEAVRKRILDKAVEGAEKAGVGLEGSAKERFNAIQAELSKLGSDFRNAVMDATQAFKFEKGGKTYTIDDANYPETMKHCADREVREALYRARSTRAKENLARIDRVLELRGELAKLLGYENYAELSLSSKCAPGTAAVVKMIRELDAATKAIGEKEDKELGENLQPWDRAFAAERLREKKYSYSEEELKKFFEVEDVIAGLFRMASFLFDIEIAEVKGEKKPSVWHKDVRFFEVREQGKAIAHFYFDPYVRNGLKNGGAWMNEFRNLRIRRGKTEELPLALVVCNFPVADEKGKAYLPMREVETIFHEFGHTLQCMLTRVAEEGAAGLNLVEWDAVELASQFMENWCLDDRTGIKVPADLKEKVRAAKNFRAASACRRQLAFGEFDLRLHDGSWKQDGAKTPKEFQDRIFANYGFCTIPEDIFLCSFGHIFAGGYAAGYYSYKWSEVMSCDAYGAFEEAGLGDDAAVRKTGRRYRDTILALGGSKTAMEVFRAFRGRDPEIAAMLRQQGLKQ